MPWAVPPQHFSVEINRQCPLAEAKGDSDPRWTTYKQAQSLDAQVMKGENGTLIQYFETLDSGDRR